MLEIATYIIFFILLAGGLAGGLVWVFKFSNEIDQIRRAIIRLAQVGLTNGILTSDNFVDIVEIADNTHTVEKLNWMRDDLQRRVYCKKKVDPIEKYKTDTQDVRDAFQKNIPNYDISERNAFNRQSIDMVFYELVKQREAE